MTVLVRCWCWCWCWHRWHQPGSTAKVLSLAVQDLRLGLCPAVPPRFNGEWRAFPQVAPRQIRENRTPSDSSQSVPVGFRNLFRPLGKERATCTSRPADPCPSAHTPPPLPPNLPIPSALLRIVPSTLDASLLLFLVSSPPSPAKKNHRPIERFPSPAANCNCCKLLQLLLLLLLPSSFNLPVLPFFSIPSLESTPPSPTDIAAGS